jgi:hypothetical protein
MFDGDFREGRRFSRQSMPISLHDWIKSDPSPKPKRMIFAIVDHEGAQMQDVDSHG